MAWSSICHSPYPNPSIGGKDKLAGIALPRGNYTLFFTILHVHTPARILAPNPTKQVLKYMNDDLQRATKLVLELFCQGQQYQLLSERQQRHLKAPFSDFYKEKLYIDCYHFLQQCKDYFNTAKATIKNCTPFAALFFRKSMSVW